MRNFDFTSICGYSGVRTNILRLHQLFIDRLFCLCRSDGLFCLKHSGHLLNNRPKSGRFQTVWQSVGNANPNVSPLTWITQSRGQPSASLILLAAIETEVRLVWLGCNLSSFPGSLHDASMAIIITLKMSTRYRSLGITLLQYSYLHPIQREHHEQQPKRQSIPRPSCRA